MKNDHMQIHASVRPILAREPKPVSVVCRPPLLMIPATGDRVYHELVVAAGRELSAFVAAVDESFGRERARNAEAHWLEVFEDMDLPPGADGPWFRQVTFEAAARLARDLMGEEEFRAESGCGPGA